MPEQPIKGETTEGRSDDLDAPAHPPYSVTRPAVRRAALFTYLGGIVVVFLIVAAAFMYWAASDRRVAPSGPPEADAIGTSGDRMPREGTPGGFDPGPDPSSTRSEIEFRGGGEPPQGTMPGLRTTAPLTRLSAMREGSPQSLAGRRIELDNVEVEKADGGTFWIRDGDATATVITPGDMPTVRAGQRVDVTGTVEADGGSGLRIRATRIDVK
jgi:hypothetical protein